MVPVSLGDILAVLRRHLWLVLGLTALSVPVAGYVWHTTDQMYRSRAVIRLGDARRALTGGLVEGPVVGLAGGRSVDPLLSEIEVIGSRATAVAVVDSTPALRVRTRNIPLHLVSDVQFAPTNPSDSIRLVFRNSNLTALVDTARVDARYGTPIEIRGLRFTIRRNPGSENGTFYVVDRNKAIRDVVAGLRVTTREDTDIVDISYQATDAYRAQLVVNRTAQVYQHVNAHASQQQSRLQREFIAAQLEVSDSLLSEARQELAAFKGGEGVYRAGAEQGNFGELVMQRGGLDAERRLYRSLLLGLSDSNSTIRRAALRAVSVGPEVSANAEVAQLYAQLVQHETAVDSMKTASPAHPDVPQREQLIASIEARLARAAESAVRSLVASLDVRIATLDDFRERSVANYQRFSAREAEQARLVEQVETAQRMTAQLRDAHQKAQLAEAVEVGQVEIVDLAVGAVSIGGGVTQKIVIIVLLGLFLGVASAFIAERLNRSIRGQQEVVALGLPVLAVVPRLDSKNGGLGFKKQAPVIEAIRGIRLNLIHAHGAAGAIVTTISSPGGGDGKSFIAANLALAFASAGHETLLIDGDTRRGILHGLLRAKRKPGLTDYLLGLVSGEIIQTTGFPRLHLIACGSRTPAAPEQLGSHEMSKLILMLRQRFSVVLVDSPPIGAGVDALTLGTVTGNMLLVVRSGMTNRAITEAKIDLVERLPIRMLGVVANAMREEDSDGYSGYYLEGYEFEDEFGDEKGRLFRRGISGKRKGPRAEAGTILLKHGG